MAHRDESDIDTERDIAIDYVLERLQEIRESVQDLLEAIDPPHQPMRAWPEPVGGLSAIEDIASATWKATDRWALRVPA